MRQSKSLIVMSAFALLLALGCGPGEEPADDEGMNADDNAGYEDVEQPEEMNEGGEMGEASATATLRTADGTEIGTVTFTEDTMGGSVQISADLHGVEGDGPHGIHLHENGECSAPDFQSAGGHFNPDGVDHACPPTTPRHAGDFGNLEISGGSGTLDTSSDLITVNAGPKTVVGHAVILHGGEDDCTSQPAGDAGPRYACGVVTLGGMEGGMGMDDEGMAGDEDMGMADEGAEDEGDGGVQ